MILDSEDLDLLVAIGNLRALLRDSGAMMEGLSHHAVWLRRKEMEQEIAALTTRWLNRGLVAAGLPEARDPATVPLPGVAARVPAERYVPAPVKTKAPEIPEMHK